MNAKIADSIGPNGKRITTFESVIPLTLVMTLLEHKELSVSWQYDEEKVLEQVKNDPFVPIRFPKQQCGTQNSEFFPFSKHADNRVTHEDCVKSWLHARDRAVYDAELLMITGTTKQLVNRLLEPWIMTRCVFTATEWDGFFKLVHPHMILPASSTLEYVWESEVNINFPAEIHMQDLAIKCKQAMDESTPKVLKEGEWHLPFVDQVDDVDDYDCYMDCKENANPCRDREILDPMLIKLSASRCAMTSYSRNKGCSIEMELNLADRLMKENHLSLFEHQAQALEEIHLGDSLDSAYQALPQGVEMRMQGGKPGTVSIWSRNFQGWIQARATLES